MSQKRNIALNIFNYSLTCRKQVKKHLRVGEKLEIWGGGAKKPRCLQRGRQRNFDLHF